MAKRTLHLPALMATAALLACLLALLAASQKSEAAFAGENGDVVAFWSLRPIPGAPCCAHPQIYRVGADGSGLSRLTDPPSVSRDGDWSPDGKKIAFTRYAENQHRTDTGSIWTMDADGRNQTKVYDFPGSLDRDPQWFPDGQRIAFVGKHSGKEDSDLYVLSLGPDGRAAGEPVRLTLRSSAELMPDVSPDGRRIAFASARGRGTGRDIYVMRANAPEGPGNRARPLVALRGTDEAPNWSPDGEKVAFTRYAQPGGPGSPIRVNVFVVGADGSGMRKLTDSGANYSPSFSPDGRWMLFQKAANAGGMDLWKMRANGSEEQLLVEDAWDGIWQPLP